MFLVLVRQSRFNNINLSTLAFVVWIYGVGNVFLAGPRQQHRRGRYVIESSFSERLFNDKLDTSVPSSLLYPYQTFIILKKTCSQRAFRNH